MGERLRQAGRHMDATEVSAPRSDGSTTSACAGSQLRAEPGDREPCVSSSIPQHGTLAFKKEHFLVVFRKGCVSFLPQLFSPPTQACKREAVPEGGGTQTPCFPLHWGQRQMRSAAPTLGCSFPIPSSCPNAAGRAARRTPGSDDSATWLLG